MDFIGKKSIFAVSFHDFYYESEITPHTVLPSIAIQSIAFAFTKSTSSSSYPNVSLGDFSYTLMITLEREGDSAYRVRMIQALKEREAFQRFSAINDVIDTSIGKRFASGGIIVFVCDDFVPAFIDGSGWRASSLFRNSSRMLGLQTVPNYFYPLLASRVMTFRET